LVVAVAGGNRHDVIDVEAGRVKRSEIVVGAVVARGCDEDVPRGGGVRERGQEGFRKTIATPTVVRDGAPLATEDSKR
jgi:hypothetical protein